MRRALGLVGVLNGCLLAGCAVGAVRQVQLGGLARYPEVTSIAVDAPERPSRDDAGKRIDAGVAVGAQRALDATGLAAPAAAGAGERLTLRLSVVAAEQPSTPALDSTARAFSAARSWVGFAGSGDAGVAAGKLELEGRLFLPDQRPIGYVRWAREGAPDALASDGGEEAARALARLVPVRRHDFVDRRAADERLLLTPTPLTLEPGEVVVSDDEVLLARIGAGLTRRVQLDVWFGGFPIPGAGVVGAPGHGIVGAGAAGAIVLGFFDIGLKVRVLDETRIVPAISISYDLLDVFGLGGGGAGLVVFGNGEGAGGFGVVAGANAQFNLFTLVAGKHFGPVQVTAGTYVLDNHNYLPQSAAFQGGCGAVASDGSGVTAGVIPCGSGSARLRRLPIHLQPFAGSELVLGRHSAIMIDGLIGDSVESSVATSGVRWLLGWSRPRGMLALDRVRLRLDLAVVWLFEGAQREGPSPHGARALPLPWAGAGFYFL